MLSLVANGFCVLVLDPGRSLNNAHAVPCTSQLTPVFENKSFTSLSLRCVALGLVDFHFLEHRYALQ